MIRNIVFDMGQVLITWTPEWVLSPFDLDEADRARMMREVFEASEWVMFDRGAVPPEEALARMLRRLPERLRPVAEQCAFSWWKQPFIETPGIRALIHELKEMGYGLYVLSNASRALHEYFPRLPGAEEFDGLLVSADWGVVKPEHEIYEKFFEMFDLKPEECFFVDDSRMNIEGAEHTGMRGAVFFGDVDRLRRQLNEAGVPVGRESV